MSRTATSPSSAPEHPPAPDQAPTSASIPSRSPREALRVGASEILGGIATLVLLVLGVVVVGAWHLTQGTSGIGLGNLLAYLTGGADTVGGVAIADLLTA
ncbi:MAG: hypothetical protein ACTH6N_09275, partial [Brachybacterium tyrofermentans]